MAELNEGASTRTSRFIKAEPERIYAAFTDPLALVDWLPPGDMTGKIHAFDARIGGGYRMSLFYPDGDASHRGKTAEKEDIVSVRFVELTPPRRIVEAVQFQSDDPAYSGEMTLEITLEEMSGGTTVTLLFRNLPRGLRAEDNEAGARLSLEQLARRVE
jgi:uncharacterized protein YndB with AHSA1/START domain